MRGAGRWRLAGCCGYLNQQVHHGFVAACLERTTCMVQRRTRGNSNDDPSHRANGQYMEGGTRTGQGNADIARRRAPRSHPPMGHMQHSQLTAAGQFQMTIA